MTLRVPKVFLKAFFEYLFYSISADCTLWDERSSVVIEPICFLKIKDMNIVGWKLIDEWVQKPFDISNIRTLMEDEIRNAEWSDLEQVLSPISKNVFELDDNPLLYPGERFEKFVSEILPKNTKMSRFIDGICHFHPTDNARFSDADYSTLKRFTNVMGEYKKKSVIALIIAKGKPHKYIEKSKESKTNFVKYMMSDLKNTLINARIFYPRKKDEHVDVSIT